MKKAPKLVLFVLAKLIEYLPFFFSTLVRVLIFDPVFAVYAALGASQQAKYEFALKTMTLPSPPVWLVFAFIALVPSLFVAFTTRSGKAVINYFLFATGIDLILIVFFILPDLFGQGGSLADSFFVVIGFVLAGALLAGRAMGAIFSFLILKIFKFEKRV